MLDGIKGDAAGKNDRKSSLLTDFYIDFMGSLVPGLFTLILASVAVVSSAKMLCMALYPEQASVELASGTLNTLDPLNTLPAVDLGSYGMTSLLVVMAYVLGSIFYRQDPKVPDHISAQLAYRDASPEDRKRLAVQPTSSVTEAGDTIYPHDTQFPYFFLYEYLKGRGLEHLTRLVPWQGCKRETWKYRTKMFINLMKIRLQFLVPEKCKNIVRNEAHVRLATSVWYSTRWLLIACIISGVMAISASFLAPSRLNGGSVAVLLFDSLIILLSWYLKRKVEKFIHYLRVREIVYVLETVHFAEKHGYNLHLDEVVNGHTQENASEAA